MKVLFITAVIVAVALTSLSLREANAKPAVPASAETVTNVCVLYGVDGVFSGGITVVYPSAVSFKSQDSFYFLWLPGLDRIKVDYLSVSPLPPDDICVGIV